jgi:4'-phosphopantetheinyl transferase
VQWGAAPLRPGLDPNSLHVYRIDLVEYAAVVESLAQLLSADERAQAERYRFARDRTRHVVAHGALRCILSRYLGLGPAQLQFGSSVTGKPYLASDVCALDLRFNLAHSRDLALLVIALGREVGADIELTSTPMDLLSAARTAFAPQELDDLITLPEAQRRQAFFRIWTCKEAYLKATGAGLSCPMDAFAISTPDHGPPRLLWLRHQPEDLQRWSFVRLTPHPEYAAAIVVEGRDWHLCCYHWAG